MSNTLQERVAKDWILAMKARDPKKGVLVLLKTELKNEAIKNRKPGSSETIIDDIGALTVLSRMKKQRLEAIETYLKGDRKELADKESFELSVIESYLPEQISLEEVAKLVQETVASLGATSPKDMGKVMGALLPKVKGKADGKEVSRLVKETLASL